MDEIYPMNPACHPWATEKINLKEYFNKMGKMLFDLEERHTHKNDLAHSRHRMAALMGLPRTGGLSSANELAARCRPSLLSSPDIVEQPQIKLKAVKGNPNIYENVGIPANGLNLATLRVAKEYLEQLRKEDLLTLYSHPSRRDVLGTSCLLMKGATAPGDPICQDEIMLVVSVYSPFRRSDDGKTGGYPHMKQQFLLSGSNKLTDLRDAIICGSDYCVVNCGTNKIDSKLSSKGKYPSGFFAIENVFYNDRREPTSIDYSQVIINWAKNIKDIGEFRTANMAKTKFQDLEIRLGFPYVYQHQGNCEHIIIFVDARAKMTDDPLTLDSYPVTLVSHLELSRYCMACKRYASQWITRCNDRVPQDPFFFCRKCYKEFNGEQESKHAFSYPFYDRSLVS